MALFATRKPATLEDIDDTLAEIVQLSDHPDAERRAKPGG